MAGQGALGDLKLESAAGRPLPKSSGWRPIVAYGAALVAPLALMAALKMLPDVWPKPYSWQFLGLAMAAGLAGGIGPGLIALSLGVVANLWFQIPSPLHPGVEMFAAVGVGLVAIIYRLQQTQRQSRERALVLHSVFEAMPDAVYVGTSKGVVLCNTNALRMLGIRPVGELPARIDAVSEKLSLRRPGSERPLQEDELPFVRALRGETAVEDLIATNAETGRTVAVRAACAPIFDSGNIIGAVAINSDITERRRAEEAQRESEQRYRKTLDEMLEGCAVLAPDWSFVYVNEAYARHARLKREDMVGRDIRELFPGVEQSVFFAAFRRCMEHRTPESIEAGYRFPDGATGWFEARIRPVPEGIFVLTLDVTERKHTEQALQAARLSAERARATAEEANQAKDHFLAVLSHELRTPLTPVLAGIALLKRDHSLSDRARDYLEILRRNVEVESRLIDDLLDVTRITHGMVDLDRRPVELRTIVERAIEVCRPDIDARGLHFGVDYHVVDPCFIEADDARLQQVFWNLLKNAIKFTPKEGCVGVRCFSDDGHAIVEVNDSGVGIEPADLSRIFDAFAQAERTLSRHFGGLGLGLTISRALIEKHGGTIRAYSEGVGKGATFSVRLPTLPLSPALVRSPASDQRRQRAARRLHVLVVEDHGDTAQMVIAMLEDDGHTVETAGDVAVALERASRTAFDLVVSDLGLPGRSGIDLLRELRARGHRMPAIAVSGYGHEEDVRQSRAAGFSSHLVKPVDLSQLLEAVDAATKTVT